MRTNGKPIPRFVWTGASSKPHVGLLTVDVEKSDIHNRTLKLARLQGGTGNLLPPLRDVKLVRWFPQYFILTGFETLGDAEVAQSWLCRAALGELADVGGKPDEHVGYDFPSVQRKRY